MKKNQSLSLFNTATALKPVKKIPLLNEEERKDLLFGKTIEFRSSYIYAPERAERHYNAEVLVQALYHTGATLINTGTAYKTANNTNENLLTHESKSINIDTKDKDVSFQCEQLMNSYNSLPNYTAWNGSHPANNPFQALFVIKVALDHFKPEEIYNWYKKLLQQSSQMTVSIDTVTFPNGSEFLNHHAVHQLLGCYIHSHLDTKFNFIPKDELELFSNSNSNFFILGAEGRFNNGSTILNQIMNHKISLSVDSNKSLAITSSKEDKGNICRII